MKRPFNQGLAASQRGFSLIEVLIAAVVLATGLLALASLQAALSRNAADARARSQVAAFVDLAVERVRAGASGADFAKVPPSTTPWVNPWTTAELSDLQTRAGVSNLNINVTGTHYDGRSGSFVVYDSASSGNLRIAAPQYKELRVVATWNDATGGNRRYDVTTIISPRTLGDSRTPFDASTGGGEDQKVPAIRTNSPAEAGVIPIAIGDNSDTAATNPKPTISSGNVIRTSYEVLTYRNLDATTVRQQRRVETAVVGCSCMPGAAPTGVFYGTPQWPAYWNGERYTLYTPSSNAAAPGAASPSGPDSTVTQDPLCTQCCRDHHDTSSTTDVRFDPFRTGSHQHFRFVPGATPSEFVSPTTGQPYLEACRMIRVDGFWRTAQDLNAEHFGLLKTTANATSPEPEHNPDDAANSAVEFYERFVIDYLKFKYLPGQTAQDANTLYAAKGLDDPALLEINRPTPADERYLHARGLYVDKIETETRAKIVAAASSCTRTNREECILPLLPFTSINLTEPAFWSPENAAAFTVDSDGFVVFRPTAPNRGRVNAIATAPPNEQSDVISRMQKSNSGVAVRDRGIDPQDDADLTDAQEFRIRGSTGTTDSSNFRVALQGLPVQQRSPGVAWTIAANGGNCQGPTPYNCVTSEAPGSGPTTIAVAAYNQQVAVTGVRSVAITCPNSPTSATTPSSQTYTPQGQESVPYCVNYRMSAATDGVETPTPGSPTNPGKVGNQQTGVGAERTAVTFSNLVRVAPPATPVTVTLTFAEENRAVAPVQTCTFDRRERLSTVTFGDCP